MVFDPIVVPIAEEEHVWRKELKTRIVMNMTS